MAKRKEHPDILAGLKQMPVPTATAPTGDIQTPPDNAPPPMVSNLKFGKAATGKKGGKNVHFFLQDEDTQQIRVLAAWLSGQGERTNDSLVVRAALQAVKADANLLKSYRKARQIDGRLKQSKQSQSV